jgi:NADH dehydrogenase FAD-containing subunit
VPIDGRFRHHSAVIPVKPIEQLLSARNRIIAALKERKIAVVVAGGGPAGLEISANLRRLVVDESGAAEISLLAGGRLLEGFDPEVRRRASRTLNRLDIRLIEGQKAESADERSVRTATGDSHPCDFLFMAVGVQPSRLFTDSGLPVGMDGGLLVNRHLQSVAHPEIFGGGDCISFEQKPLAKVGVYAVRQNPVLLHNLGRALNGGDLAPFNPQESYLLAFNMGDGTAIVRWKSLVFNGRLGFALKDYLDRRFMKMFQPAQ